MSSGAQAYHTCPLRRKKSNAGQNQDVAGDSRNYAPIWTDLDTLDPVAVATVRPALQVDRAVMNDDLATRRTHDSAPISRRCLVNVNIKSGRRLRDWHGLDRETVADEDILLSERFQIGSEQC